MMIVALVEYIIAVFLAKRSSAQHFRRHTLEAKSAPHQEREDAAALTMPISTGPHMVLGRSRPVSLDRSFGGRLCWLDRLQPQNHPRGRLRRRLRRNRISIVQFLQTLKIRTNALSHVGVIVFANEQLVDTPEHLQLTRKSRFDFLHCLCIKAACILLLFHDCQLLRDVVFSRNAQFACTGNWLSLCFLTSLFAYARFKGTHDKTGSFFRNMPCPHIFGQKQPKGLKIRIVGTP